MPTTPKMPEADGPITPMVAQAVEAQEQHQDEFLAKNNVVGVAVGLKESEGVVTDEVAVVVLVQEKKPLAALSAADLIPKEIDGLKTDVIEVGYLRAQQTARDRFRPIIPSGVSIGHYKITAGTLGTMVKDKTTGEPLVLSNNHVLANSNDATVGDAVLQPAAMDGGREPGDLVARLERFQRIFFTDETMTDPNQPPTTPPPTTPPGGGASGCDLLAVLVALANALASIFGSSQRVAAVPSAVIQAAEKRATSPEMMRSIVAQAGIPQNAIDAALARPLDQAMFADEIRQIGVVNETKTPTIGMAVRKYGRTTEFTTGTINLLNATVDIAYSTLQGQRTARFTGQVIASAMSQGGDSGSLVVDAVENKAVGLLFAGSTLATIFTPIDVVLNTLNITL
jgi:hypothetical protein